MTDENAAALGHARGAFRRAVLAKDLGALMATFADDAVLQSPISFEPFAGKPAIRALLAIILEVFEGMRYTDELDAGDGTKALVFRATVGGKDIQGLDLLRFDEHGLVRELTVMVRPRSGMEAVLAAVGPRLAAARREEAASVTIRQLGTAVFGGMLTSTFLAVLFVPVFYVVRQRGSERLAQRRRETATDLPPTPVEG